LDLKDMSLKCFECGAPYSFTVEEQQAFNAKGRTHAPKRCPQCRAARAAKKTEHPVEKFSLPTPIRQMFAVTCTVCGKDTQVPFEPRAGRPVYCSDCYHKLRTGK
jgi:CxxC-x17-CxxC domain-containing protein